MSLAAIVFTVASLHINDSRHYNQINPGAGFEWAVSDRSFVGSGAYVNSSGRLSVYGTVGTRIGGLVGIGIESGLVTGYKYPVLPLVFPFAYWRLGRFELKVNVLPTKRPIVGFQVIRRYN